jgi:hypothetical protein
MEIKSHLRTIQARAELSSGFRGCSTDQPGEKESESSFILFHD